jgi:tetratricopeptide (TPR) repeat protein
LGKFDIETEILWRIETLGKSVKEQVWEAISMNDRASASAYNEARRGHFAMICDPQELQQQIDLLQDAESVDCKLLAGLYSQLGNAYNLRLEQGTTADPAADQKCAIAAFQQAVNYWGEHATIGHIQDLNQLGTLYSQQQRYEKAEQSYKYALRLCDAQLEPEYAALIETLKQMAQLYSLMQLFDEAQSFARRALALSEAQFGSDHPQTAISLDCMANLYIVIERYDSALPLYKRALAIHKAQLGPGHPESILSWTKLANTYRYLGEYQQAETLALRAITISELELGWLHPHTEVCLDTLIKVYLTTKRYGEAERRYCQTLDAIGQLTNQPPNLHAKTRHRLGKLVALVQQVGAIDQLSDHWITEEILNQG